MDIGKKEIDQRMKRFETVCRERGVKLTHQRREVFREVARTGDHPDADQVFQRIKVRMPTISLDTVYRSLWLMNNLGLLVTLGAGRDRTRFDANLKRHHHFVCRRCGLIRDFYCSSLDDIRLPDSVGSFGEIEATHIEVRGICRQCSENI